MKRHDSFSFGHLITKIKKKLFTQVVVKMSAGTMCVTSYHVRLRNNSNSSESAIFSFLDYFCIYLHSVDNLIFDTSTHNLSYLSKCAQIYR